MKYAFQSAKICIALASGVIGTAGEYIPFVLILVGLCKAMRLDAMTAVGAINVVKTQ